MVTPDLKVDEYETGAVRESGKEERYDLVPSEPIRLLAVHYGKGAKKYAPRNWEKGLPFSRLYNSAMRHMEAFKRGEDIDEDTGSYHLIAAIWNLVGIVEFYNTHPEMDDRK